MEKAGAQFFSFIAAQDADGARLDVFLSARTEVAMSRAQIKKAILSGKVFLNRSPAKVGQRLREGDQIQIEKEPPAPCVVIPEAIPLDIVYEDRHLIVINKPAGMVVHPAAGNYQGTLVHALVFHCRDLSGIGGVLRPGIVHRLDKGTSGLLVVAKSDAVHQDLAAQFERHEVKKTYMALVYGSVEGEEGMIDFPIGRDMADRKKMSTRSRRGKEARTYWRVRQRYGVLSLLEVNIETGRTHQIRVHLSRAGFPVVGDTVYGSAKRWLALTDKLLGVELKKLARPALHAQGLQFKHPATGDLLSFTVPLPEDLASLCAFLKESVDAAWQRDSADGR